MRLRPTSAILGLSLFLLMPALSRADTIYTFDANIVAGLGLAPSTINWSFDVPSLLTTTTTITSFSSASVTGVLSSDGCAISSVVIVDPSTAYEVATEFSGCGFGGINFTDTEAIAGPGTYGFTNSSNGNSNTLTVTDSSAVPEPGTFSLMLLGIGLAFIVRKRIAKGLPQTS